MPKWLPAAIVAFLILGICAAYAQPVPIPDDSVSFIQLERGQWLTNDGKRWPRTKFMQVHGKPGAKAGLVSHRPTAVDPQGRTVNLSLHGWHPHDLLFTGEFDLAAMVNTGVEEGTYTNIVVDAKCGVAKALWTTVDLWGLGCPHGPTLSGGNIVSMRLYGPGGAGFMAVGEVTDLNIGQVSTSGTGTARFQVHTVPSYQWPQWNAGMATSEGMPKRIVIGDARMAEGVYETGIVYSKQAANLTQPPTVPIAIGGPWPYQVKVQALGLAIPGGETGGGTGPSGHVNPPAPPGSLVPVPAFGPQTVTAPRQDWAGRTPSIGYFPITLTGSPTAPAIFNFVNADNSRQRVPHKFYFTGSYAIINGLDAHKIEIGPGSHHVVFQNCRAGGDAIRKGAGFAIGGGGANPTHNIVIANCEASDNGDWLATFDEDFHGLAIGGNVSYVWVTGSKFYHNSGDAIQINAGSLANQPTLHHVYVYSNEMWECKQTGGATKQARHVVFADNYVHDMRPIGTSPSAWGAGFGHQYGAGPIWFVANRIEKCSFGIQSGSTSGLGDGQDAYYIFNRIDNIRHDPAYAYNPATAWSNAGLALVGNPNKYAIGNTIRNADGGIYFPGGSRILVEGNVLADVLNQDVWLEDPNGNQSFNVLSNIAWPTAELRRANQPLPWPIGNIVADPATAGRTWIPSPEAVAIFDKYQAEFGVDLRAFKGSAPWAVGAAQ